jgi:hypothetical protein
MTTNAAKKWAREEFGSTQLGDVRRTRRLVDMAARAARRPSGKVAVVFDEKSDREGAYDFLESPHVDAGAVAGSMFAATAARTEGQTVVFVALDTSMVTLTDTGETKGFGPIGSPPRAARGLMVMNALAVDPDGVPLGLIDQRFWVRPPASRGTVAERTERNEQRPFEDKQGAFFVRSAEATIERLQGQKVVPWFVIDREGDSRNILLALSGMACAFTIRGTKNRCLTSRDEERNVRESVAQRSVLATDAVRLRARGEHAARVATVEIRAHQVELRLRRTALERSQPLKLYAVVVRETGTDGRRADALNWLLYTNAPITTEEEALQVVRSYRARWRVEEFHRTWKQGGCNVETAQLRSVEAITKWATILSSVAVRIERIKYLSRNTPDAPATIELDSTEIEALKIERKSRYPGKPVPPLDRLTIGTATTWIAEMGGWMGQKSSGPPGSITIARGLQVLAIYAKALVDARNELAASHGRRWR